MTTTLTEITKPATGILYAVTLDTIRAQKAELLALKVNGLDDTEGLDIVTEKRKMVAKWRISVEKTRKEAKEESLRMGKEIDSQAKALQAEIEPLEQHLLAQEESVERERQRLKDAAEEKRYQSRLARWSEVEGRVDVARAYLLAYTEEQFEDRLAEMRVIRQQREEAAAKAKAEETERQRLIAEQQEANRLEQERLKAEREEFEKQQAEAELKATGLRLRMRDFANCGMYPEASYVESLSQEQFEAERKSAIERRDHMEQLQKDREAKLAAAEAEIEAEKKRLADIEAEWLKAEADEKERLLNIEQNRIFAEKKVKAEADARAAAELAAQRTEELKPVRQRIDEFALKIAQTSITSMAISDETAEEIRLVLRTAAGAIRDIGKALK